MKITDRMRLDWIGVNGFPFIFFDGEWHSHEDAVGVSGRTIRQAIDAAIRAEKNPRRGE